MDRWNGYKFWDVGSNFRRMRVFVWYRARVIVFWALFAPKESRKGLDVGGVVVRGDLL